METNSAAFLGPRKSPLYSKLKSWGLKPLVLDFYMQRVWPTFSLERILAKVASVRPASSSAVTIRLRPNFNFRSFQAGQHVLVTSAINGYRLTRTYSPTRLNDGSIEITVKKVEGGKVSTHLNSIIKRGSTVEMSAPFGEMTWAQIPQAQHFIFCAGGVGITPIRSLIREWDLNPSNSIELHYWAKSEAEFCFRNELIEIASRRPALRVNFYASDAKRVAISEVGGRDGVVIACGPQNFVQSARAAAEANGQKFVGEFAAVTPDSAAAKDEKFFDITYDGHVFQASSKKTLLESLEEQGFTPAQGCRMGICKSCTCMKTFGTTFSSRDQADASEDNEEIQICVSAPRSALNLEKY